MIKNSDKYIQALKKRAEEMAVAQPSKPNPQSGVMIFNLVVTALLVLAFCLNILFFVLLKNSRVDQNSVVQKLAAIEEALKDNGEEVKQFNYKLSDIRKLIKEISETNDGQSAAIENLTKAKNNIFNRVTELEAGQEQLKKK